MAAKVEDENAGQYCTVLLTNLPSEWFRLEDQCKREALGSTVNALQVSCSDESKRTAVVRVSKLPGSTPTLKYKNVSVSSIIVNEKTAISFTLSDSQDCHLLETIVKNLNMGMEKKGTVTYIVSGSLDMIVNFRKELEECIMRAHVHDPDGPIVNPPPGIGAPAALATVLGPGEEFEQVEDRFNADVLVILKSMGTLPGVQYSLSEGLVFVDRSFPNAKDAFYSLYDQFCRQKLKTNVIPIPKHMSISVLKNELESLKQKHDKCYLAVVEESLELRLVSTSSRQFDSILKYLKDFLYHSNDIFFEMPGGRVLKLLKRDIVQEKVDIIVNAANGRLDHGGGVAGAINRASNGEVQNFSRQLMKKRHNTQIPVGDVAVTSAGKFLGCKQVIHAVGPESSHYDCQGAMIKLVHAILNAAEKCGARSIALPAISTGIFGVDKDLVAWCFFTAIANHRFSKLPPILEDIRVVIIDQPTFSCFHRHFSEILLSETKTVSLKRSSSMPSDREHGVGGTNPTYARVASEYRNDSKGTGISSEHDKKSKLRHEGNQSKNYRDRKSTSPSGSDGKVRDCSDRHNDSENKGDVGSPAGSAENAGRSDGVTGPESESSRKKESLSAAKEVDEKLKSSGRERTKHESAGNCFPEKKKVPKPSGNGGDGSKDNEPFFDAIDTEGKMNTKVVGDKVITSDSSESCHPPDINVRPDVSSDEIEYPELKELSDTKEVTVIASSSMSDNMPVVTSSTFVSHPAPPTSAMVTPTPSMPQHLVPVSSASGYPTESPLSKTGGYSTGLNPNAPSYSSLGKCSTCGGQYANVRLCGHHQCTNCSTVKYPLCPACSPWLSEIHYYENIPATTLDIYLADVCVSGYAPQQAIVVRFKFPKYVDAHRDWWSNQETFITLLPYTEEGKGVAQLFQRAYNEGRTFTLVDCKDGLYQVMFTHALFKIKADGGGLWGYPDPGYLDRVKKYLEVSLSKGSVV